MRTTPIRTYRHDTDTRPFIVIWEMTQACPLACLHCRAEARPDRHPGELTTDEARDLMAQVAEFGSPPPVFVLTGGDPFQRPDLFDLIRHGAKLGIPVAVSPSGTPTPTADRLAGLREAGARAISLSLDGSTAEVHDQFRGVPGVFGWTLDAWQAARDLGLKVQINTTVTGHNLAGLADIAALVSRLGAVSWSRRCPRPLPAADRRAPAHNLKEERVLYPRADDVLPPPAAARLRAFLGSGELPDGWVCAKARPVTRTAGR